MSPSQTAVIPVMADGKGLTVNTVVVMQPVGNVYVIVTVPDSTPVTVPVDDPTVAIAILLLDQVPPPALDNVD